MEIFLDENFPLQLMEELEHRGFDVIHVIPEGLRGVSDNELISMLKASPCLFLTKDDDFFEVDIGNESCVLLSRISQSHSIDRRVSIRVEAIETFFDKQYPPEYRLFELTADGSLIPQDKRD